MFYYIDVHLLAHYIHWIKMHCETVKFMSKASFRLITLYQLMGHLRVNYELVFTCKTKNFQLKRITEKCC
jgi:hypothetical protein